MVSSIHPDSAISTRNEGTNQPSATGMLNVCRSNSTVSSLDYCSPGLVAAPWFVGAFCIQVHETVSSIHPDSAISTRNEGTNQPSATGMLNVCRSNSTFTSLDYSSPGLVVAPWFVGAFCVQEHEMVSSIHPDSANSTQNEGTNQPSATRALRFY